MKRKAGKHLIFAVTWITYAGFYFCRKNLSIALPLLHKQGGLPSFELANIVFGYSLLYAVGQFTCGLMSDWFGPARIVGTGLLLIVASNLLITLHTWPVWLLAFACLNGAGQSTGWSGLVKIMGNWFSGGERGVVMAWWSTNYVLGGFLATTFATWAVAQHFLAPQWGWRRGFIFPALVVLAIAILFFLFSQDSPRDSGEEYSSALSGERFQFTDMLDLLRHRGIWSIGISYFFLEMCRYALLFWLPYYMVNRLRFGVAESGYVSSLYELVGIIGALIAGYVSDRFLESRRAPVSAVMLLGFGAIMLLEMKLSHDGVLGMAIVVALAGLLTYGPDTLLSGAGAQDIGQRKTTATASGLIDGIGHLGALISPYLVVLVSQRYGWDRLFLAFMAAAILSAAALTPIWNLRPADEHSALNAPAALETSANGR